MRGRRAAHARTDASEGAAHGVHCSGGQTEVGCAARRARLLCVLKWLGRKVRRGGGESDLEDDPLDAPKIMGKRYAKPLAVADCGAQSDLGAGGEDIDRRFCARPPSFPASGA